MEATARPRRTRFGAFEVDLRSGEVHKHGIRLKLQDQPFQVLALLLEHPGEWLPARNCVRNSGLPTLLLTSIPA